MVLPNFATFPLVDVILLLVMAGFVFYGLFFGLIKTLGSLLGVVAGAWVASRVYLLAFDLLAPLTFGRENLGKILLFLICFTIVNRLVGLLFALLDKAFNVISIVPFLKTINRLAGALLGFVEGGLVIGLGLYVVARYVPEGIWAAIKLHESQLAPFLLKFANIIVPLLPEVMRQLQSIL